MPQTDAFTTQIQTNLTEEQINDEASQLIAQHGDLCGQSWENVNTALTQALNGDLNSILHLINLAYETGFSNGSDNASD